MRIVLFGDIHVYKLAIAPWHLIGKRLLGQMNLWLNRRKNFDLTLLKSTIDRMGELEPDLLLCTGDLTTSAIHGEFAMIKQALSPLLGKLERLEKLEKQQALIIPGNHDRYSFTAARVKRFEQYFGSWSPTQYPYHRKLPNDWHLIAIDACRPNFLLDRGNISEQQLTQLQALLEKIDHQHRIILMCHYTPGTPPNLKKESATHALIQQEKLTDLLKQARHEIYYLHGHVHRPWCWRLDAAPNVVAINAGAPLYVKHGFDYGQGIWQIDLSDEIQLTHHRMTDHQNWRVKQIKVPIKSGHSVVSV